MKITDSRDKTPLFIFLSLLCFYSLLLSPRFDGYELGFYATAFNFVTSHEFNMGYAGMANAAVVGGKAYAEYVLQCILDIPMVAIGLLLDLLFRKVDMYPQLQFFLPKALNAVLTSLTAATIYLFGIKLYRERRISLALAFIYGLATMAMPYATIGMDPLFAFLAILGFYLINVSSEKGTRGLFALAGLVFGLAMGAKTYAFIIYPSAALYIFLLNRGKTWTALKAGVAALLAGGLAGLVPWFWYNYHRFGQFIPMGRTTSTAGEVFSRSGSSFLENLYASFFSAGKSFFLYSPPLVFAVWGLSSLFRKKYPEAPTFLAFCASIVLVFCTMNNWADEVWGTRYYLVLVPFMVLTLGAVLQEISGAGLAKKGLFYLSIFAGFLVQIPGSIVYYGYQTEILARSGLYSIQNTFYVPALSHIRLNLFLISATLQRQFTGDFPYLFYYPGSNIGYKLKFDPVQIMVDPTVNYIEVWWRRLLFGDMGPGSMSMAGVVLALFAGFILFGLKAYGNLKNDRP